jgi:hypothetical protein
MCPPEGGYQELAADSLHVSLELGPLHRAWQRELMLGWYAIPSTLPKLVGAICLVASYLAYTCFGMSEFYLLLPNHHFLPSIFTEHPLCITRCGRPCICASQLICRPSGPLVYPIQAFSWDVSKSLFRSNLSDYSVGDWGGGERWGTT